MIDTDSPSIAYSGNGSTVTGYPVTFPYLGNPANVRCGVKASGATTETLLTSGQYSVHTGVGGPFVRTATACAGTTTVRIFRAVPRTQPLTLPPSGPLSPPALEAALDRLTMLAQDAAAGVAGGATITPESLQDVMLFADATARTATSARRAGQLGVQFSDKSLWISLSTNAGDWQLYQVPVSAARQFATRSLLMAAAPAAIGQAAWAADNAGTFIATGTGAGAWSEGNGPGRAYCSWNVTPWEFDEPILTGQKRWGGHSGLYRWLDNVLITVAQPGQGELRVKLSSRDEVNGVREIADITLQGGFRYGQAADGASYSIAAAFRPDSTGVHMTGTIEAEIVRAGVVVTLTSTGGNEVSTPGSGDLSLVSTGSNLLTADGRTVYIASINGDGTLVMSHPAQSTGAATIGLSNVQFIRRIVATLATGDSTITVPAALVPLLRSGDMVSSPLVPDGTFIESLHEGTGVVTLSTPLLAAGTSLSFVASRPPALNFTAISASSGATSITLPVTTKLRVGDAVVGTNFAASTEVTAKTSTSVTLSAALTGNITEATFTYPRRLATATAGSTSSTLNSAANLPLGSLVTGPGIAAETFLDALSGTTATLSAAATVALSSTALEFSRDEARITGGITSGSDVVTLPYAAALTALEVGFAVTHPSIRPGAVITAISGSQLTLSVPALATNAAAVLRFARSVPWKGLCVTLSGPAQNSTL